MINPKDYYEHGLALHGHKCPAMPMGLRVVGDKRVCIPCQEKLIGAKS